MLRDFCMLKRDGISANMASIESTLRQMKALSVGPQEKVLMQGLGIQI